MRFVRIGNTVVNLDKAHQRTGLEPSFVLTGEEAELFRRHLEHFGVSEWKPKRQEGTEGLGRRDVTS